MATSDASLSIGRVVLRVKDIDLVADFYARVIGLAVLTRQRDSVALGAGARPLIELRKDQSARFRPQEAGLYHTAFLLPERSDLGAWLRHAAGQGLSLDGASDHLVSEALYIRDPEGNGVEVYWDRPPTGWVRDGQQIKLDTSPLDLTGLADAGTRRWSGAPEGSVIGHVHLQVGDIDAADHFMAQTLGLTKTYGLPSAGWYGASGYHHHLAANIWNSRGAQTRSEDATGLIEIELITDPQFLAATELLDPWGTRFHVTAAQSRAA